MTNKRPRIGSRIQSRMRLHFHYEVNSLGRWYRIWTQHIDEAAKGVADLTENKR